MNGLPYGLQSLRIALAGLTLLSAEIPLIVEVVGGSRRQFGRGLPKAVGSVSPTSTLRLIFCDHSAVTMRLVTRLTSHKFALFPRSSAAGRTGDSKCIF